jgi:hypothetical protein
LAYLAYTRGDLSRGRLAELLGTSLMELDDTLASYGLVDEPRLRTELTATV